MNKALEVIKNFCKEEDGVTAIEYGLIAAFVAVAIITAFGLFGGGFSAVFTNIGTYLTTKSALIK